MRVFDLHCDTLTACCEKGLMLSGSGKMVDLKEASRFDDWVQFFAVFVPGRYSGEDAVEFTRRHICYFKEQAEKYPALLKQVRSSQELSAPPLGGCKGILSIEGARAFAGKLSLIDEYYQAGVRMTTLTWNGENELGYGVAENKGLKEFGKRAVQHMLEIGMAVDVSHLSDAGLEDVFSLTDAPVVASHSNFRVLCGHRRNLTDGQAREIIRRGGLIGLNFFTAFLNDEEGKAGLDDLYRHLEHGLSLGGEKVMALGSDFDGAKIPPAFDSCGKLPGVYEYLLKKNYGEALLDDVFYGNAARFFDRLLA